MVGFSRIWLIKLEVYASIDPEADKPDRHWLKFRIYKIKINIKNCLLR